VDRPAKTVSFSKPKEANDVLNEWSGNIHNLLGLCEKLEHLIMEVSCSIGYGQFVGGNDACCCETSTGTLNGSM
jgi:hypothetical protein